MIKYRPHRGGLSEAMAEAKEFDSMDDVKIYVYREHKGLNGKAPLGLDDIVIGEVLGDDDRIGWKNVRRICVKRYFADDYMAKYGCPQCIGWCGEWNVGNLAGSGRHICSAKTVSFVRIAGRCAIGRTGSARYARLRFGKRNTNQPGLTKRRACPRLLMTIGECAAKFAKKIKNAKSGLKKIAPKIKKEVMVWAVLHN